MVLFTAIISLIRSVSVVFSLGQSPNKSQPQGKKLRRTAVTVLKNRPHEAGRMQRYESGAMYAPGTRHAQSTLIADMLMFVPTHAFPIPGTRSRYTTAVLYWYTIPGT